MAYAEKQKQDSFTGYRSLFWPIVLIGVGLVWLLGNLGLLTAANLSVIARLWPLALIVIGLDMLFGRRSPMLGAIIGIGAVVLVVALMFVGPSIGLGANVDVQTGQYTEPLADANAATINIGSGVGALNVDAQPDSNDLFSADISYVGEIEYFTAGTTQREVTLRQANDVDFSPNWFVFNWSTPDLHWDVSLNPDVPLMLNLSNGVGAANIDLSDLQLEALTLNNGVGTTMLTLPNTGGEYDAEVNIGTGNVDISIEDGAALKLSVSGGVGEVSIDVPENVGVRLEASSGVGSVNVPNSLQELTDDDDFVGESGIWQSDNFSSAERQITITYSGGVGSLTIR